MEEKLQRLKEDGKDVVRFSVTGYSLGGLHARYMVGYAITYTSHRMIHINVPKRAYTLTLFRILYSRGFFRTVLPVNFTTFATPHLGLYRYSGFLSPFVYVIGSNLLGRTGKQFWGVDEYSTTGKPLLEIMVDKGRLFVDFIDVRAELSESYGR